MIRARRQWQPSPHALTNANIERQPLQATRKRHGMSARGNPSTNRRLYINPWSWRVMRHGKAALILRTTYPMWPGRMSRKETRQKGKREVEDCSMWSGRNQKSDTDCPEVLVCVCRKDRRIETCQSGSTEMLCHRRAFDETLPLTLPHKEHLRYSPLISL